jgi:hypothetical protein
LVYEAPDVPILKMNSDISHCTSVADTRAPYVSGMHAFLDEVYGKMEQRFGQRQSDTACWFGAWSSEGGINGSAKRRGQGLGYLST